MNTCRTCRHWRIETTDEVYSAYASRPTERAHWGACERTESNGDDSQGACSDPNDPATLAYAVDGERFHAVLVTAPEFGCVQHSPANPSSPPPPP